jgi:hypothetical protein
MDIAHRNSLTYSPAYCREIRTSAQEGVAEAECADVRIDALDPTPTLLLIWGRRDFLSGLGRSPLGAEADAAAPSSSMCFRAVCNSATSAPTRFAGDSASLLLGWESPVSRRSWSTRSMPAAVPASTAVLALLGRLDRALTLQKSRSHEPGAVAPSVLEARTLGFPGASALGRTRLTSLQSHWSSSATIIGQEVNTPVPISVCATRIVTLSSGDGPLFAAAARADVGGT